MERIYKSSAEQEYEVFGTIVEDKLLWVCEKDEVFANWLDSMNPKQYTAFVDSIVDNIMNSTTVWEATETEINEFIAQVKLKENIK